MPNIVRVMAIDPGTVTIGVAFIDVNVEDVSVYKVETSLYDVSYAVMEDRDMRDKLTRRVSMLYRMFMDDVLLYRPRFVVLENGFSYSKRPGAYGPLSKAIGAMELAVHTSGVFSHIFKFSPKYIKKRAAEYGGSGKGDVLEVIRDNPELKDMIDFSTLSEHEVDAVAVGYTLVKHLRDNPHILML